MHVIDVDPDLLRQHAAAATHAAEQAAVHMAGEIACLDESGVPKLLETLTPRGPWAWAILPEVSAEGAVEIPIATTLEEIAACYRVTRNRSNVLGFEPLVELRGTWYTFQEGLSRSFTPATGRVGEHETIALFPVTTDTGITGELAWWRMPPESLGAKTSGGDVAARSSLQVRRDALALHDRFVEALRGADVDDTVAVFHDGARSAVRDLLADSGTLVGIDGHDGHRDFYRTLFERYEIASVELLSRVVQDWYLFAELRFTVVPRTGPLAGQRQAFHTAEFCIPAADGRFISRIGHATDLRAV